MEAFYSPGDLTLVYINESGIKREISMAPEDGKYKLFLMPPNLAHAIVNRTDRELVMVEFANEEQHDVEKVQII